MKIKFALLGTAMLMGGVLMVAAPASAAPLGAAGSALTHKSSIVSGDSLSSDLIVQVQVRRGGGVARGGGVGRVGGGRVVGGGGRIGGGGRAFGGGGRVYGGRRYGGGGYGGGGAGLGVAAGVLGVLGAAAAAGAMEEGGGYYAAPAPVYGGCYITREAAYDDWGNFVGYRRVRVCQ